MRWRGRRGSENVEDMRSRSAGAPMAIGGGLGTLVLIIILMLMGVNPQALFQQMGQPGAQPGAPAAVDPAEEELAKFVSVALADTEDVWRELFRDNGMVYREPKLVLFRGQVQSACGFASAAVGPFYCPADEKLYVDLSFLEEMGRKLGASGDFAQAYVIAHEVGHHVQKQLGMTDKVHAQQGRISKEEYNDLSVRLELQADFYAGVWAHHAQRMKNILERGDIEEAMGAAAAVGDDRLQKRSQGYVVPESFTHGTSEQRARWFNRGFKTGDMRAGNTFATDEL